MEKLGLLIGAIRTKLKERPLAALEFYEQMLRHKTASERSAHLEAVFEDEMAIVRFGKEITRYGLEQQGARLFSSPRQSERELLVAACAAGLVAAGRRGETDRLQSIGAMFKAFVLNGTQQQKFCGRLGIALGLRTEDEVRPLQDTLAEPLIDALLIVLRVGAAPTRDTAVEGLGALLKYQPRKTKRFDEYRRPLRKVDPEDDDLPDEERQHVIDRLYFDRLDRRRMMVLAVAGDPGMREELFGELRVPIAETIANVRTEATHDENRLHRGLLNALYARADLLRTLPGLIRQAPEDERQHLRHQAIQFLRDAAEMKELSDADDAILRSFAHFQESVFRTIDVMIKRGATHDDFESVLTTALHETRYTLVGHSSVCNARVRATFALIQTAARLIRDDHEESSVKRALLPLFRTLASPPPWANLGIVEGCFYVVPFLAGNPQHENLVEIVFGQLFERIAKNPPGAENLPETHRQLIANACFRRMLLVLMQRTDERSVTDRDSVRIRRDVSRLLNEPKVNDALQAFRVRKTWSEIMKTEVSASTTGVVIAGTDFETNLLTRTDLFSAFDDRRSVNRLFLTRILAAQLRAASLDWREIGRYDLLRQFWENMPTVFLSEEKRDDGVRELMSKLPARAAQAADPDLQDFFEHCGRRLVKEGEVSANRELPGHVLAMISEQPSSRIADAIAREIELSLRHDGGDKQGGCDLGRLLYQVALRGPSVSIFSRLLPRVEEPQHQRVVQLFKKHVKRVGERSSMPADQMLQHVDEMIGEIAEDEPSETLRKLRLILTIYRGLFADGPEIWSALENGNLGALFRECDAIMELTRGAEEKKTAREPLGNAFGAATAQLQTKVAHYRKLPIGEFDARAATLEQARSGVSSLAVSLKSYPNLKPPELVMLMRLLDQLDSFFKRTISWYCKEPGNRKNERKETRDPETFFNIFATGMTTEAAPTLADSRNLEREKVSAILVETLKLPPSTAAALARLNEGEGPPPAELPDQQERFEEYFVHWMESELDIDMLQRRFEDRWKPQFRWTYRVITRLSSISAVIVTPYIVAIVLDLLGAHEIEGVGFFLLEAGVLLGVCVTLIPLLRTDIWEIWRHVWLPANPVTAEHPRSRNARLAWLTNGAGLIWRSWQRLRLLWTRPIDKPETERTYYFESLIPRLVRLIVVPLALSVEFDHSYSFPLHASTWSLTLLIVLSFFTTRFFVDREIVDPSEGHTLNGSRASERDRVGKVVALALSHAFVIAVLLVTIFGSHANDVEEAKHELAEAHSEPGIAARIDAVRPETGHKHSYFAGVLARDLKFDAALFLAPVVEVPPGVASHLTFYYYPTIILAWTALGLFVGVFLEGFAKGEKLRGSAGGEGSREAHAEE